MTFVTTQQDLDPFITENSELHWAQAKIYAAIFAEQNKLEEVLIQLTYCQVSTGIIKNLVQKHRAENLAIFLHFSLQNYMGWLAGFVVMGGIFGEGIDLSGDRLSGAAIVGVGLPGISPERELIKYHFTAQNEPGFNYAYLFPGMNRVFQAAGRVIRSEKDRGAVLLIDSRYTRLEYSSLFPGEWQTRRIANNTHMKRILDRFWNHDPQ